MMNIKTIYGDSKQPATVQTRSCSTHPETESCTPTLLTKLRFTAMALSQLPHAQLEPNVFGMR